MPRNHRRHAKPQRTAAWSALALLSVALLGVALGETESRPIVNPEPLELSTGSTSAERTLGTRLALDAPPAPVAATPLANSQDAQPLRAACLDVRGNPAQRGVVVDAYTGVPITNFLLGTSVKRSSDRVTDGEGSAPGRASASLGGPKTWRRVRDPAGCFCLSEGTRGTLVVEAEGYEPARGAWNTTAQQSAAATPLTVRLEPLVELRGRVMSRDTGLPISGAQIEFRPTGLTALGAQAVPTEPQLPSPFNATHTLSTHDGSYLLTREARTEGQLEFSARGYASVVEQAVLTRALAGASLDVALSRGGVIAGVVKVDGDTQLEALSVDLQRRSGSDASASWAARPPRLVGQRTTQDVAATPSAPLWVWEGALELGPEGRFERGQLHPGQYRVVARSRGRRRDIWTSFDSRSDPIQLRDGERIDIVVDLHPPQRDGTELVGEIKLPPRDIVFLELGARMSTGLALESQIQADGDFWIEKVPEQGELQLVVRFYTGDMSHRGLATHSVDVQRARTEGLRLDISRPSLRLEAAREDGAPRVTTLTRLDAEAWERELMTVYELGAALVDDVGRWHNVTLYGMRPGRYETHTRWTLSDQVQTQLFELRDGAHLAVWRL